MQLSVKYTSIPNYLMKASTCYCTQQCWHSARDAVTDFVRHFGDLTWLWGSLFRDVDIWDELSNDDSLGLSVISVISNSGWKQQPNLTLTNNLSITQAEYLYIKNLPSFQENETDIL